MRHIAVNVVVALTAISTIASSEPVTLEFVKGVTRLNTNRYRDYYFSCNTNGCFLQWQYNKHPLTGFLEDDEVGRSVVLTSRQYNYSYTASLLSSEPLRNGGRAMDSILMISFTGQVPSDFTITCSNDLNSKTVSAGLVSDVEDSSVRHDNSDSNSGMGIVLDYITSSDTIVTNTSTHIFMCGANYNNQHLRINNNRTLVFHSSRNPGFRRRVDLANRHSIYGLGIFVARNPFVITTLLIVADNSDVEVACFQRNVRTRLSSNVSPVKLTTDVVTESDATQSPKETVELTNGVTNSEDSTEIVSRNKHKIDSTLITTISVSVLVVTVLIILIPALGIFFHMRKK